MSSSPSSSNSDVHTKGSPTPTEASSPPHASTPPRKSKPAYTVVNNVGGLKGFLDAAVKHLHIPPKLYSRAHCLPNTLVSGTLFKSINAQLSSSDPSSSTPQLYVDAEGISLSRSGELFILIIHLETKAFSHTYLIHVHVLRRAVFNTKDSTGIHSLKTLFEDNRIPKVLFDCRMDSDALFGQYAVLLAGVIDLQLMCLASRGGGGRYLPGLESCLLQDLAITAQEREWVAEAKAAGQLLWRPRFGGSMERFNENPLHEDIVNYCVVDAANLPRLFETYNRALGNRVSLWAIDENEGLECDSDGPHSWECKILELSKTRVERALDPGFRGGDKPQLLVPPLIQH